MHRLTQALKQALDAQLNAATTGNAAVADRHFRFLVGQLAIGTVGLAAFPVWLALDPGGSSISSLAFLWLLAPLATVVFVLKTGRLQLGQIFASLALTGLVCWLALKTGGASSPFVVLLAAVPLSDRLTGPEGRLPEVTIIAFAGLALVVALSAFGAIGHPLDWVSSSPTLVVAGVAVGLAGFWRAPALQGEQNGELAVSLIDEGGDLITRHDDGGDVVAASQMARELLGVEPDELHGRGMAALVSLEDRVRFDEALHQACSGEATVRIRYRIRVAGTPLARNELVETTFRRSNARLPSPSIVGVTRTVHSADRQPPSSGLAENKEAEAALETMVGFADLLSDPRLVRAGSQEWRSYANLMRVSGEQLAAALRGSGDNGSRDHELPVEGSGRLATETRKAVDLANAAGAGCPVEIAAGAVDVSVDVPAADSTRLILGVLLTLRRQMPADVVLAVSIGEREKRARLEIKAVAPQPFVQRRTTYNSQASIVDLGLMESAEITAKWGGDLSIESHTRFGPVVVLELPKARPDSGGQHRSEEQWGEVRKSA